MTPVNAPSMFHALLAAPPSDGADSEYEVVEGFDQQTTKLKREYEAQVERKVSKDYSHVVWAYGIIWTLFAAYGVFLLLRVSRQQRDLADLQKQLSK